MAGTRGHRPHIHAGGDAVALREVRIHAEWSDAHGVVNFAPWGQCTLQATPDTLMVRVDATDEESLRRIQEVITSDLGRFGRRDHLTMNWQRPEAPSVAPGSGPAT
jgi:hypothetical protein